MAKVKSVEALSNKERAIGVINSIPSKNIENVFIENCIDEEYETSNCITYKRYINIRIYFNSYFKKKQFKR